MHRRLLFVHALSPLHAGTGQSVGAVDLAIARERATGIPYLPGSSIKGVLRDHFDQRAEQNGKDRSLLEKLFGPPTDRADEHAGSVQFGDARLLFMPVRSLMGTFAYVTSPYLLDRFATDAKEAKLGLKVPSPTIAKIDRCVVAPGTKIVDGNRSKVLLEDLDLRIAPPDNGLAGFARTLGELIGDAQITAGLAKRICVVHDDVMSFLLEQATEVVARIRLDDEKKTVAKGALWYEESLPAESVLVSLVVGQPPKHTGLTAAGALEHIASGLDGMLQFGGKVTVGRGFCTLKMPGGAA